MVSALNFMVSALNWRQGASEMAKINLKKRHGDASIPRKNLFGMIKLLKGVPCFVLNC